MRIQLLVLLLITTISTSTMTTFEEDLSFRILSDGTSIERIYTFVREDKNVEDTYTLRMSSGQWLKRWGPSSFSLPPGASLAASFDSNAEEDLEKKWKSLKSEVGGLYCTSLSMIGDTHTVREDEKKKYHFANVVPSSNEKNERRFYGVLPKEALCTENLTPWLNMLPCRDSSGIASTIDPLKIFSNPYYAITIEVNAKRNLVTQRLVTVSTSFNDDDDDYDAALSPCEVSTRSTVQDLNSRTIRDLIKKTNVEATQKEHIEKPSFSFTRHAVQVGVSGKGLETLITNHDLNRTFSVTYSDFVPWFLKLKYHTLRVIVGSVDITETLWENRDSDLYVRTAKHRGRPAVSEIQLNIPPLTTARVSIEYDLAFLAFPEFPPDPNRGFDVPSALLTVSTDDGDEQQHQHVFYTGSTIVMVPLPDFSMPFNVLTLTSSIIAFFFGHVFNLFTRKRDLFPEKMKKKTWFGFCGKDKSD